MLQSERENVEAWLFKMLEFLSIKVSELHVDAHLTEKQAVAVINETAPLMMASRESFSPMQVEFIMDVLYRHRERAARILVDHVYGQN